MSSPRIGFEYFVLRYVPSVEREEFANVGVVLLAPERAYLACACDVRPDRVHALAADADLAALDAALVVVDAVCRGDASAGPIAAEPPRVRFGWLAGPRSTVLQRGPVHAGLTDDPARELAHLLERLVR